jgi:hypothetical protein
MNLFPRAFRPVWLLPAVGLACTGQAPAQGVVPSTSPALTRRPAVVITMPTEAGKVYQMQVSPDLKSWTGVGEPLFGTGAPLEKPMPGVGQQFFRLQVMTEPVIGPAPWALQALALQFNEGRRVVHYDFPASGAGTRQTGGLSKSFTWTYQRTSLSDGGAVLTFPDGSRETLQLQFSAVKAGRFTRQTFLGSRLEETDDGSFGPAPKAGLPLVPPIPTGYRFAFSDQPSGGGLSLTSASGGTRLLEGQSASFNGNWLVTGSTSARLIATFSSTHGEDYRFTFTGPQTGTFTRQTFTEGIFRDQDVGTFCLTCPP